MMGIVFLRALPCIVCNQPRDVVMIGGVNVCAECLQHIRSELAKYTDESVRVKALTPEPEKDA